MTSVNQRLLPAVILLGSMLMGACGGGGGDSESPTNNSGNSSTSTGTSTGSGNSSNTGVTDTYTEGVYQASSDLINRCVVPRTGTDEYTGEPYPDQQGSAMYEKLFLRSFTDETYLWYSEVADLDPTEYSISEYFERLKTNDTTESGRAKDQYHYTRNTAEYKKQINEGVSVGYGLNWRSAPNRDWRITYVEPNSPADEAGIQRGDQVIGVDGVAFATGSAEILNGALFPGADGEQHSFTFRRINGAEYSVNLTAQDVTRSYVDDVQIFTAENQRQVGYYRFNSFYDPGQTPLISAFSEFSDANVSELIVDLRYNGGGYLAMASQMAYMVAGFGQTDGKTFEQTIYNDKITAESPMPFYRYEIDWSASQFIQTSMLPSVNLSRVYVLTTDRSCSASEAFINGLRGIDIEVILIGGDTCGKPYGFRGQDNCDVTYFTIQFKGVNAKGFGDYADGFIPTQTPNLSTDVLGCPMVDDLNNPLGTSEDSLIGGALTHIATGNCPSTSVSRMAATESKMDPNDPLYQALLRSRENNKILTPVF